MTIQHQKIFSSNSPQIYCVEYQKSQAKHDSHKGAQRNQLMNVSERVRFCKAMNFRPRVTFYEVRVRLYYIDLEVRLRSFTGNKLSL